MSTILITSGGTKVRIDEVRHVGNMSSGRFGADIARAALEAGHEVIFLYAKGSHRPDQVTLNLRGNTTINRDQQLMLDVAKALDLQYLNKVTRDLYMYEYADFDDYARQLERLVTERQPDVTMLAAAVSDYGMPTTPGKISSDQDTLTFTMVRNPKLITRVKEWSPKTVLVGFKLLVNATWEEELAAVDKQRKAANSDLVVVNDLRDIRNGEHQLSVHSNKDTIFLRGHQLAKNLVRQVDFYVEHGEI